MLNVCYVVVSTGWDRHAQMAWLSAYSVRLQDPGVRIVVVVEGATASANDTLRRRFSDVDDVQLLFKSSDVADPVRKSRYHRIVAREYMDGDLLYVDSDTLCIAPIAGVTNVPGDVGAVIDFNGSPEHAWCPPELEAPFRQLGWTYPIPHFMNAGVFLVRDSAPARAFCREWLARWCEPAPEPLRHTWDQATFNSAVLDTGVAHAVLPNGYNAMVVKRNYRFRESRLLHFFGSVDEQRGTLMAHLLRHLQQHDRFDRRAYERSIRQGHPWGPSPEAWQLRHSRNYVRAAAAKVRQVLANAAGVNRSAARS